MNEFIALWSKTPNLFKLETPNFTILLCNLSRKQVAQLGKIINNKELSDEQHDVAAETLLKELVVWTSGVTVETLFEFYFGLIQPVFEDLASATQCKEMKLLTIVK